MSTRPTLFALATALLVSACGGSDSAGSFTLPPEPVEVLAPFVDGGEGTLFGPNVLVANPVLFVGDTPSDEKAVIVLCFDLTGIGTVEQATVGLTHVALAGDPWVLGMLHMDHIDGGGVLDLGDATSAPLTASVHTLLAADEYELDVTAQVAEDLAAGRTVSTFRLRYDAISDSDGAQDSYRFAGSKHVAESSRPTLVITHLAP